MKDYKLYTYISLLFIVLYSLVSVITVTFIIKNETISILNHSINSLNNQTSIIANMCEGLTTSNLKEENLIPVLQKTIANTEVNMTFVSVVDWTGNYVCYPDITKVGQNASKENAIDYEQGITGFKLYNYLKKESILNNETLNDEIINLQTIINSDLLIASHIKTNEIEISLEDFKTRIYSTFFFLGLILLLLLNAMIRIIGNYYSKQLESRVLDLEFSAKNLAKLNDTFSNYQDKALKQVEELLDPEKIVENSNTGPSKERFLTYVRNELLSISTKDIAYIYVENTITYIIRKDGKLSTSNETLDKIYATLDQKLFFKANRQFIISIASIKKITKYENTKLIIEVNPECEIDIIIGKNKASEFKRWLDL